MLIMVKRKYVLANDDTDFSEDLFVCFVLFFFFFFNFILFLYLVFYKCYIIFF